MKVRIGFVSNSSSSSYAVYGAVFNDIDDVMRILKAAGAVTEEEIQEAVQNEDEYTLIRENVDNLGENWNIVGDWECMEEFIVGRNMNSIRDEETGKQFKDSVVKQLKEWTGSVYECDFCVDQETY